MCKGPSINDVTQILGVFGPPPPLVTHFGLIIVLNPRNLPYYVMFWTTPLPPLERDVIYGWSLVPLTLMSTTDVLGRLRDVIKILCT